MDAVAAPPVKKVADCLEVIGSVAVGCIKRVGEAAGLEPAREPGHGRLLLHHLVEGGEGGAVLGALLDQRGHLRRKILGKCEVAGALVGAEAWEPIRLHIEDAEFVSKPKDRLR